MRLITSNLRASTIPAEDGGWRTNPRAYFKHQQDALRRSAELFAAEEPDVICLQEVGLRELRSGFIDPVRLIASCLEQHTGQTWNHRFLAFFAGQSPLGLRLPVALPRGHHSERFNPFLASRPLLGGFGLALLTKHPVRRWVSAKLGAAPPSISGHLRDPRTWRVYFGQTRSLLGAELRDPERGSVLVGTTHLELNWALAKSQLARCVQVLSEASLCSRTNPRVVLCGDLNLSETATKQVLPSYKVFSTPSFPNPSPTLCLDQVIGQSSLECEAIQAFALPLSDHLAVSADLHWRK